jgi:hypothetical protein
MPTESSKPLPPISVRPKPATMTKIRKIAKANGLSIADVINLCLASGTNIVEAKLGEIHGQQAA